MQHKRSRAMASPRSPFLFVLLALAVGGTANAHDDGLPAFRYSAELLGQLQLPSVALPLNDDLFLYGRDAEAFDLEAYLAVNAPALRDKSEYLEHWSGYYSINPKVLLTLMVMQSGPLGRRTSAPWRRRWDGCRRNAASMPRSATCCSSCRGATTVSRNTSCARRLRARPSARTA